jgi:hypothetical protein
MNFKPEKTSLLILTVTALVCSRIMFALFNDPEGPNLLIVTGAALFIGLVSLAAYFFTLSNFKKLSLAILIQIVVTAVLYLYLR